MLLYNSTVHGAWSMVGILQNNVRSGLIDLSQKDEVVMRLLLRKAYMDTIIAEQGPEKMNFSKGCNFLRFLKALFAEGFYSSILECQLENNVVSPGKLADAFEHAVVRFTHFAKAADESTMTTRGMVMGFLRGAAIIGRTDQKIVDIAIPILLNSNDRIQEASMSAFLVQVKRRYSAGSVNAYLIDTKKLGFFPKNSVDARPYVTLVAELGINEPPSGMAHVVISEHGERSSNRNSTQYKNERPRYGIRAYACTDKTWKVIAPEEVMSYKQILGVDTLLTVHPRQTKEHLDLVRRMLPYWHRQPAWFSDGVTPGNPVPSAEPYEDPESDQGEEGEEQSMGID